MLLTDMSQTQDVQCIACQQKARYKASLRILRYTETGQATRTHEQTEVP